MAKFPPRPKSPTNRSYKVRADAIEHLRQKNGLSLDELARKSLVAVNTIKRWLRGAPATIKRLHRVAVVLGSTGDELVASEAEFSVTTLTEGGKSPMPQAGYYECRIRLPVEFSSFNPKAQIPEMIELMEKFLCAKGEISVSYIREGSVTVAFLFSDRFDVGNLVEYYAGAFETAVDFYEGFFESDMLRVFPADDVFAEHIANRLAPILYPRGRVGPKALERELKRKPSLDEEFIVLGEYYHGSIHISRSPTDGWTIANKLFMVEPETDHVLRLADELEFPELLAGKLPPKIENLSQKMPELARRLRQVVARLQPSFHRE